jgi:ABC-type cobalamin/Fe3+-siderophores transport system ATPase subunit
MNRGSTWRKWDLHVHTPLSFEHSYKFLDRDERSKYNEDIWAKYIDELKKIKDVSVIGITDYFSIDGYKKLIKHHQSELSNFDLILPNIEFRLDVPVKNNKKVNYHVIFSDEVKTKLIEREFLNKIQIEDYTHNKVSLCRENIEEIGQSWKNQDTNLSGSKFHVGCRYVHTSLDDIKQKLEENDKFLGKYLLVLAERGWHTLSPNGQTKPIHKKLLRGSDAVFCSNQKTISWLLGGGNKNTPEKFIHEYESLKPSLHGSDAHSFEEICNPVNDKFCWIKADPTFEGLKQILYDPTGRVKIGEQPENSWKYSYSLDLVKINNSKISQDLSIEESEIYFNKNLVAIIGGKGTGKTALLDLIANCFEDRCKRNGNTIDENSFVQRIESKEPNLDVEIGFIGNEDNFCKNVLENKYFEKSQITYFPQGKIDKYSSDPTLLNKKIQEIIFNNDKIIQKGVEQDFKLLKEEISEISNEISEINNKIYDLEQETSEKILENINREIQIKKGEFINKTDEISNFTETLHDYTISKIEEIKEEEILLKSENSKLDKLKEDLINFKVDLEESINSLNDNIDYFSEKILNNSFHEPIPKINPEKSVDHIDSVFLVLNDKIKENISFLTKKQQILEKFSASEQKHAKLIEELEDIKKSQKELNLKFGNLIEKTDEVVDLEDDRIDLFFNLLSKYLDWDKDYKKIISIFSEDKLDILGEVDFKSRIDCDKSSFIDFGQEILHSGKINKYLRVTNREELSEFAEELESLIYEDPLDKSKLKQYISILFNLKNALKDSRNDLDFYNWIFGDYFSLITNVYFDGRAMETLSMGQKGTVLLKLFLSEGEYPLIMDQPEDNLDNKFIYTELVGAFKKSKKNRQIIIATNNANLVVNADAEQIIIAEFEKNQIKYSSGSLEDIKTRNNIMRILEGGKKAFKEREMRYGIDSISSDL